MPGCEVLLDLSDCDPSTLTDPERLRTLGLQLWRSAIQSQTSGEPTIVRLAGEADGQGYSLIQLAAGASLVGHFNEAHATAAINLFCFDGVDAEEAERVARQLLGASRCQRQVITGRVSHL